MPLYEYRCPTCGQTFEKLVRLGATEAPPCPSCGAAGAERLISVIARTGNRGDCGSGGMT